jgi:hypothetical protein
MISMTPAALALLLVAAQTPQPFPRPSSIAPQPPRGAGPAPSPAGPSPGTTASSAPVPDRTRPSPETLVFPVYPTAQFLASYDAGRGQRYYLFGTTAAFAEIVAYYRKQLDERGELVFKDPPTHMFEVGRFREETMAFPPGVTVKDWTSGGLGGYLNPKPGAEPGRFPTVIMIVPPPPAPTAPAR